MRPGRKIKTHTASYDSKLHIPGLSKQGKRWRVTTNGKEIRFTEPDEQKAINKAMKLLGIGQPSPIQRIETTVTPIKRNGKTLVGALAAIAQVAEASVIKGAAVPSVENLGSDEPKIGYNLDPSIIWSWVAKQFSKDPDYVAQMIGAPFGSLRNLSIPKPSIRLSQVVDTYKMHNPSTDRAKRAAIATFKRFTAHTSAKTLSDLTHEKLLAFKLEIEKEYDDAGYKQFKNKNDHRFRLEDGTG
jgi:hypothetical protein